MKAITISHYVRFGWVAKDNPPPPMTRAFTTGYYNVFNYTPELEAYLTAHNIGFRIVPDKYDLLIPRSST